MIIALVIWLIKNYAKPLIKKTVSASQISNVRLKKTIKMFLIFVLVLPSVHAQESTLLYDIKLNGNVIGSMKFFERIEGSKVFLELKSQVVTKFVFGIKVTTLDQSQFNNGELIYSSVSRMVNGMEKDVNNTRLKNSKYQTLTGNKAGHINSRITYNMMLLYKKEPVNIDKVYSDNFQEFLPIKKIENHTYRIKLSDGNYNDYQFHNGMCKTVMIHHSLYTIKMELI
jgi:hypothetical protein